MFFSLLPSLDEEAGLPYIFVSISMGHTPFNLAIPGNPLGVYNCSVEKFKGKAVH